MKPDLAEGLIRQDGTISVQSLNEAANVARRKMHLSWDETKALLSGLSCLLNVVL